MIWLNPSSCQGLIMLYKCPSFFPHLSGEGCWILCQLSCLFLLLLRRTSTASPRSQCSVPDRNREIARRECQREYQIESQNRCQIECQKEWQIECQKRCYIDRMLGKMWKYMSEYMPWDAMVGITQSKVFFAEWIEWFDWKCLTCCWAGHD